jgi:hypothetical protein
MTARKTPKQDNPEQSKRFIDMAREIGVDERPETFDLAFGKVMKPKTSSLPEDRDRVIGKKSGTP